MKDKGYAKSSGAGTLSDATGGPTRGGSSKGTGTDTGKDSTNVITKCGSNPKEYSPSSTSQSKNR